jgi:chromosome partitioning protein
MSPAKSVQQVLTKTARRECRILLLSSPKGGVGKSTLSQNILSLAAKQGLKALAVDLDPQQTLSKWFVRREAKSETSRDLPMFDLLSAELGDWQRVLAATQDYELAVIDTLPSLDHLMPDIHGLCSKADLVLVPTGATQTDLDSTVPWLTRLGGMGFQIATVLNKANRRENFFQAARGALNRLGPLCPVEVRNLSDAHAFSVDGLCAADKPKSKAYADFLEVWHFVQRELKLGASR